MKPFEKTERTTVKRLPLRGAYDRELVYSILDEGLICHVGFAVEGRPFVIPTGYARHGDQLYIHGSQASRMLRTLKGGIDVCVTVTLLQARSLVRKLLLSGPWDRKGRQGTSWPTSARCRS